MTNKQLLEHALAFGYPVRVTWESGEEEGTVFHTMLNGFKFNGDDRKHDYVRIVSVEPLEPVVEKPETVYEYIRREFSHMMECWPVGDEVDRVLTQAQKKYGVIDSVSDSKPNTSPILDQQWHINPNDDLVYDDNGYLVHDAWALEIEALPGAYKALVRLRDDVSRVPYHARAIARDALKKAGIA